MESVVQYKPNWKKYFGIGAFVTSSAALVSGNALAANAITDLFTAVDITGVQGAVYTFLLALIAIGLLFFGRRLLKGLGVSV